MQHFLECPHFELEPCSWAARLYQGRGEGVFDNKTDAARRLEEDISQHVVGPETASKRPGRRPSAEAFEVVLSFAATEWAYARELATAPRSAGVNVFYHDFYTEKLWGKDLVVFL